jgi:hypothetical protein
MVEVVGSWNRVDIVIFEIVVFNIRSLSFPLSFPIHNIHNTITATTEISRLIRVMWSTNFL